MPGRYAYGLIIASIVVVAFEVILGFPVWLRDLVRSVELIEATAITVLSLVIGRRYFLNYRADQTKARLLPRHVVFLAGGTVGLCVAASAILIDLLTEPFLWYVTPITFPTLTILLIGLLDMVEWLPQRTAPPDNSRRRRDDDPGHNERRVHVA